MERNFSDRRGKGGKYFIPSMIIVIGLLFGFIFFSPQFERESPVIQLKQNSSWNMKSPLEIKLSDNSNLVSYKVTFIDDKGEQILEEKVLTAPVSNLNLKIAPPKFDTLYKGKAIKIKIEAVDDSQWVFLSGNTTDITYEIVVDTKAPEAIVLNNSRYIARGGSALVVVKVVDENLLNAYITFNDTINFKLIPFNKPNYYAALIAWDINIPFEGFQGVNLVAIDKAGNKSIAKVPLYIQDFAVKNDNLNIPQSFIDTVSRNVLEKMNEDVPQDLAARFVKQNRELRAKNIATIKKVCMANFPKDSFTDFPLNTFVRLQGSSTAAGFGERRHYFLDNKKIDEAWHLGLDWASIAQDNITVSNGGDVIFKEYLGIYGNTIIVNHGLGLATLYAHTTSQFTNVGEKVTQNQKIATTGVTGAVLGDHLHFGVLVQGIEVNPIEWMDPNWIKTRITDILTTSKAMMN
ncbi:MAG: M23 family metallopeptidase [Epsilonproteobacteria bacterium]|nr:M23 family metallopeptidase [Campylobacterota bacterium]